jgi:hypothetical protein
LLSPPDGARVTTQRVVLDWTDSPGATSYKVQVRWMSTSGPLVVNTRTTLSKYQTPRLIGRGMKYFWRAAACIAKCSAWTDYWTFTIAATASVDNPHTFLSGVVDEWDRDDWMFEVTTVLAWREACGQNH